mmetsp:Transcript_55771/g.92823  ORF Transcript_55771/g.92823 Transcript_55771/m.92823 type:complete len:193 (-) Transcript_55771:199-777(-)
MKQAAPTVCLVESDDEDYVSMDEDDLNTGITALYNVSSADEDDAFAADNEAQKAKKKKKRKKPAKKDSKEKARDSLPQRSSSPLQSADASRFRCSYSAEDLPDTDQQPNGASSATSWRDRFSAFASPNATSNNNSNNGSSPPRRRRSMFGSSANVENNNNNNNNNARYFDCAELHKPFGDGEDKDKDGDDCC